MDTKSNTECAPRLIDYGLTNIYIYIFIFKVSENNNFTYGYDLRNTDQSEALIC